MRGRRSPPRKISRFWFWLILIGMTFALLYAMTGGFAK